MQALAATVGSIAFNALARCVLAVTKDKDDPKRRLVLPVKNNLSNDETGLAYEVRASDSNAPYIAWESSAVTITAEDALSQNGADEHGGRQGAEDFLKDILASGPLTAKEVQRLGGEAGYPQRTVQRAANAMGIKPHREGFGAGAKYLWELPCAPKTPMDASPPSVAHMAHMDQKSLPSPPLASSDQPDAEVF